MDKKIRELMKVCNVFELKKPTTPQIETLLSTFIPKNNPILNDNIIYLSYKNFKFFHSFVILFYNVKKLKLQTICNGILK